MRFVRHHFGIVPDHLLDSEDDVKDWLAEQGKAIGLAPQLVALRETRTYEQVNGRPTDRRIRITVAEGFCIKGKKKHLPIVTYGDLNADDWGLPLG